MPKPYTAEQLVTMCNLFRNRGLLCPDLIRRRWALFGPVASRGCLSGGLLPNWPKLNLMAVFCFAELIRLLHG